MERSRSQGLGISIATSIHFCTGLSTTSDRSGNIWRNNIASSKISISDHCGWRRRKRRTTLQDYRGENWYVVWYLPCDFVITHWVNTNKAEVFLALLTARWRPWRLHLTSDHWIPPSNTGTSLKPVEDLGGEDRWACFETFNRYVWPP